jgi:hypothetical protein
MIGQIMLSDFFAAVLAGATIVLVIVTWLNVRETKEYGKAMTQLVEATQGYVHTTTNLVEETKGYRSAMTDLVDETKDYVSVTTDLVNETREYAKATNELVAALTNPILYVDISLIERPMQNLVGVPVPEAFEVFVQNVGPGSAYDVNLDVKEDLVYVQGSGIRHLKEEIIKSNVTRLAPGQRRSLVIIIIMENLVKEKLGTRGIRERLRPEFAKHEVTVSYKNVNREDFNDSFLLDFTYYFELIKRLLEIPHPTSTSSDRSDLQKLVDRMKPDKKPPYATYALNLTEKEQDFTDRIYNSAGGTVTQWVMSDALRTLAKEAELTEQELNDYSMLFRDSGLVEVEIYHGGAIAMLKLTAYGVHYARSLKSKPAIS